jgi:predicted ATPase/class 3 adenylate cyclase
MTDSARELPSGAVTFLFSDIEGSTRLLQEVGEERYAVELVEHRRRVRQVARQHRGVEVGTEGDAFFIAFASAADALSAAEAIQAALSGTRIRVRVGVHSGEPLVVDGDYVGLDVHKAARICSAAHGGQVLVSSATRELSGAELRDLGEHRLKDLAASERLYQLGADEFPPLRTLRRTNLPVQPTPLLGRNAELMDLLGLVREHRLVTLSGPGGTGKTRLALELAAEVADSFDDGVWWVPLAGVEDAALVQSTITQVLAARDGLAAHLADKRLLLLLDNLEHLLDAAPMISELLVAAPELRVVCTSRERLGLPAEHEYPLPPLTEAAATELFATRARQVRRDFQVDSAVPEICRRLDCLPLALELSATRVKIMTPMQILDRLERRLSLLTGGLRGLPERQSTMRATIEWSYDLLTEREQRVFRALGVFAGSFDLEAAERIVEAELDDLQSLVDKSLVRMASEGRFFLLETTREYALERLEQAGEYEELRRRHAAWFFALATTAEDRLRSHEQGEWLDRLRDERDNLRAVLAWSLDADRVGGLTLARTLYLPWHMDGQLGELIEWFARALANPGGLPPKVMAASLETFGAALSTAEDYDAAEAALEQSLALWRDLDERGGEGAALNRLGSCYSGRGDVKRAVEAHEHALELFRDLDDRRGLARSLHLLGENLRDLGELDRARSMLEESVAIENALGDLHSAMTSLHSLGDLALDAGQSALASQRYHEALSIAAGQADDRSQAYCLAGLACVAAQRGEEHRAGCLWEAAEAIERRLDHRMLLFERIRYERVIAKVAQSSDFDAGRSSSAAAGPDEVVRRLRDAPRSA